MDYTLIEIPLQSDWKSKREEMKKALPLLGPPDLMIIQQTKQHLFRTRQQRQFSAAVSGCMVCSISHASAFFHKIIKARVNEGFKIQNIKLLVFDAFRQQDLEISLSLPGSITLKVFAESGEEAASDQNILTAFMSSVLRHLGGVFSTNASLLQEILLSQNICQVIKIFIENPYLDCLNVEGCLVSNHQNLALYLLFRGLLSKNMQQAMDLLLMVLKEHDQTLYNCFYAVNLFHKQLFEQCFKFTSKSLQHNSNQFTLIFYQAVSLSAMGKYSKAIFLIDQILHLEKSNWILNELSVILFKNNSTVLALNLANSIFKIGFFQSPRERLLMNLQIFKSHEKVKEGKKDPRLSRRLQFNQQFKLTWVSKAMNLKPYLVHIKSTRKQLEPKVLLIQRILASLKKSTPTKDNMYTNLAIMLKSMGLQQVKQLRKSSFYMRSQQELEQNRSLKSSFIVMSESDTSIVSQLQGIFELNQDEDFGDYQEEGIPFKLFCADQLEALFQQLFKDHQLQLKARNSLLQDNPKDDRRQSKDHQTNQIQAILNYSLGMLSVKLQRFKEASLRLRKAHAISSKSILKLGCNYQLMLIYQTARVIPSAILFMSNLLNILQHLGISEIDTVPVFMQRTLRRVLGKQYIKECLQHAVRFKQLTPLFNIYLNCHK